jgi:hypothetical protein
VGQAPAAAAVVSDGGESFAGDVACSVRFDPHALMLALSGKDDADLSREFDKHADLDPPPPKPMDKLLGCDLQLLRSRRGHMCLLLVVRTLDAEAREDDGPGLVGLAGDHPPGRVDLGGGAELALQAGRSGLCRAVCDRKFADVCLTPSPPRLPRTAGPAQGKRGA